MRVIKIMKSWKFWLAVFLLPFVLVGCSNLFINFDSDFIEDETASRHTVEAEGITLSYLRAGDPAGQRVILLHGTPGDAGGWIDMLRRVPEGYEFIAVDRPGFGHTRPKKALTSLAAQAAVLNPLLVGGNGKGAVLLGHSLGGPIVVQAATDYPDRVTGLVVAAGSLDPDLEEVLFIQRVGNVPPFRWLLNSTPKNANRELIDLEAELRLLAPRLGAIKTPTVIVHGTADDLVPYANVAFMQREMVATPMKLITLEGQNHFLPWNSQDQLMQAIMMLAEPGDFRSLIAR